MVTQQEIARRAGLGVSSVNRILSKRVGPRFRKDTVARVLRIARELGFDFGQLKHSHRRRHERQPSGIAVGRFRLSRGWDARWGREGCSTGPVARRRAVE